MLNKALHTFGAGIFTEHQHASFVWKIYALNRAYAPKPGQSGLMESLEWGLALETVTGAEHPPYDEQAYQ